MAGASADPTDGSSQLLALLGTAEGDAALAAYVASLHPPGRGSRSRTSSGSRPAARTSITRRSAFRCAMRLACWTRSTCTRTAWTGSRGSGDAPHGLRVAGERSTGKSVVEALGERTQGHGGGFRVRAVRRARRETRPGGGGLGNPRRARAVRVAVVHVATRDARRATPSRVGAWKGSRARDREEPYRRRRGAPRQTRAAPSGTTRFIKSNVYPKRHPLGTYSGTSKAAWSSVLLSLDTHPPCLVDRRVAASTSASTTHAAASTASARSFSFLRVLVPASTPRRRPPRRGNAYPLPFLLELLRELLLCRLRRRPEHPDPPGDSAAGAGGASP